MNFHWDGKDYGQCRKKFIGWAVKWVLERYNKRISEHELVDLYHDAIFILLKKIDLGTLTELTSAPCTYLIGVGEYIIPAWLRKRGRINLPGDEHLKTDGAAPEISAEEKLLLAELWDEVDALGEPGRTILYMTYKLGLSNKEIAELMGYSSDDVARQLRHRHLQELRCWHKVNQLDEPCRSLLHMAYRQRLNDKEIAVKMGFANAEAARQQKEKCLAEVDGCLEKTKK